MISLCHNLKKVYSLLLDLPYLLLLLLSAWACLSAPLAQAASGNAAFVNGSYRITFANGGAAATISVPGIQNTTSSTTSGSLGFELWYSPSPYSGGSLSGYKVAASYLPIGQCSSPTLKPGASCVSIQVQDAVILPPAGVYYPVLILVEYSSTCMTNGGYCVDDYRALVETVTGSPTVTVGTTSGGGAAGNGVSIVGSYSYTSNASAGTVQLNVSEILNSSTRTTGTLRLELWLTSNPYSGGSISGHRIGVYQIAGSSNGKLGPNQFFSNISTTIPLSNLPSAGTYYISLLVTEFTQACGSADGFCIDTYGAFSSPYIVTTTTGAARALSLVGAYSYSADFNSNQLQLNVAKLLNSSTTHTTGTLRLELWLTAAAYSGGDIVGNRIGVYRITGASNGTLGPNQFFSDISVTVPMTDLPGAGSYFATLVVTEYTQNCGSSDGYCISTYGTFSSPFTVASAAVSTTSGGGSGGGGGALDWLVLGAILAVVAVRRYS